MILLKIALIKSFQKCSFLQKSAILPLPNSTIKLLGHVRLCEFAFEKRNFDTLGVLKWGSTNKILILFWPKHYIDGYNRSQIRLSSRCKYFYKHIYSRQIFSSRFIFSLKRNQSFIWIYLFIEIFLFIYIHLFKSPFHYCILKHLFISLSCALIITY